MTFALLAAGSNGQGQLGIGSTEDVSSFTRCSFHLPGPDSAVVGLAAGANHTLLLLRHGVRTTVYASGSNERGQLGPSPAFTSFAPLDLNALVMSLGDEEVPPHLSVSSRQSLLESYSVKDVGASWETSFIHLRARERMLPDIIISFGANDWGELGRAGASGRTTTVDFSAVCADLKGLRIRKLVVGPRHAVALIEEQDGNTLCVGWGAARHGQLGSSGSSPPRKIVPSPSKLAFPTLPFDPRSAAVSSISLGRDHTVIHSTSSSTNDAVVVCLGSSRKQQLGTVPSASRSYSVVTAAELGGSDILQATCTWNSTFVVLNDRVLSWGSNSAGQLARSTSSAVDLAGKAELCDSRRIDRIACGSEHVVALVRSDDGKNIVLGWGWNEHGNLGTGDQKDVWKPCVIWRGAEVIDVFAGNGTSWLVVIEHESGVS
jgi:protein ATS1